MISEQDLQEAIAECQGARKPDASTCIKLAAFYTIRRELYGAGPEPENSPVYSHAPDPEARDQRIDYQSNTEFSALIDGRPAAEVWPIVDELVTAVQVLNPRLYGKFIQDLQ